MESFDAQCTAQELTVAAGATPDLYVPGRITLLTCFSTMVVSTFIAEKPLSFYNGSDASGTKLFEYYEAPNAWGPTGRCMIFPGDGLLFDSGLFVTSGNTSSRYFGAITVVYQKG
tara:strand:+ start:943 stop:1287 length:345 start_codon:yes stop_codon:yes gene_type:complete